MAEAEVSALKEALCNQYVMMKLYSELEEEREASASAASEALSMILRLEREKAAEKMEASQYKRMAEEKMHHAEECILVLEEVIQQNEMEITSLKYQLESYKQKLSGLGVDISDIAGIGISGRAYLSGSNVVFDDMCFHGFVRRNISLPSLLRLDQMINNFEDNNNSLIYRKSPIWRRVNEKYDGCGIPYLPETKEVNKKLKGLMQDEDAEEIGSCSKKDSSQLPIVSMSPDHESGSCSCHSKRGDMGRKSKYDEGGSCLPCQIRGTEKIIEINAPSSSCSEAQPKNFRESLVNHESRLFTQSKGNSSSYQRTLGDIKVEIGTSRVDFEQLKLHLKKLEEGKLMQEDTEKSKEQLMVLRNMVKQLNRLKTQIKRSTSKRHSTQENYKVVSIMEAVLSFWL